MTRWRCSLQAELGNKQIQLAALETRLGDVQEALAASRADHTRLEAELVASRQEVDQLGKQLLTSQALFDDAQLAASHRADNLLAELKEHADRIRTLQVCRAYVVCVGAP